MVRVRPRSRPTPTRWTAGSVTGPPAGSPGNASDWRIATESAGQSTGDRAAEALDRQPEIIRFLSGLFGPYPFRQAGGIVDNDPDIGFALENQTRPIYAKGWFQHPGNNTYVVVHELAHQWTGDDLAARAVAAHLAQRGLRQLHGVAVVRARG